MSDDEDPEVVADIQLRARTVRERGHRADRDMKWTPPVFVTKWRCKVPACQKLVDVTRDAVDAFETFNRQLIARNEQPLDNRQIMFCDSCRKLYGERRSELAQQNDKRMATVIKQLKQSRNPEEERELVKQLEAWGHPDVPGLVAAIRARLDGKGTNKRTEAKKL